MNLLPSLQAQSKDLPRGARTRGEMRFIFELFVRPSVLCYLTTEIGTCLFRQ